MRKSCLTAVVTVLLMSLLALSSVYGQKESLASKPEVAAAIAVFDAWVQQTVTDREQPGLSVGLVYDQDLIWAKGYGYADLSKKAPATPATAYRIASLTKLFTATAILQLRDAGQLQLDDPVAKYAPWFQLNDSYGDGPVITIRHLLTHTSGIPRELKGLYWDDMKFPDHEAFMRLVRESEAILPRETEFKYSNVAYALLGDIVSNVSGETYAEYVAAHILKPLGMMGTEVMPRKDMSTLATGYKFRKPDQPREIEPFLDLNALSSAGNMASTVEDLAKFLSLQFREGPAGGAQILKGSTLSEMHRIHWLDTNWQSGRGLGWGLSRIDDRARIEHSGYVNGHTTFISACPAEKFGVIILANANDGKPWTYAEQAWSIVAPAIVKATAVPEAPTVADESLKKYTGKYVWSDGSLSEVMLLNGELAIVDPQSDNPWTDRARLKPVTDGVFKLENGWQKGELIRFEADSLGEINRMVWPGYAAQKL